MNISPPKTMRLVSHEQRVIDPSCWRLSHNCGGAFSETDVVYDDRIVFVDPECFVCAERAPRDGRYRSSRDRVMLSFARGTRAVDVYMWPDEFEKTFGYSIYQIKKGTEE